MEKYTWFVVLVALNSLLLIALAAYISKLRYKHNVSLGDGENKTLFAAIRAHANAVEQFPVYALLILGLTLANTSSVVLALLVLGFTAARIAHAVGMNFKVFMARKLGAGLTYLFQLVATLMLLLSLVT